MCRADYALGKAIRDGQDAETIATRGGNHGNQHVGGRFLDEESAKPAPSSFIPNNGERQDILALAGGREKSERHSPSEFEEALTEAKAEGNLSRADYVVGGRIVCYKCFHCNDYFS